MSRAVIIMLPILLFNACSSHQAIEYQKTPKYGQSKLENAVTSEQSSKPIDFNHIGNNQPSSVNTNASSSDVTGRKKVKVVDVVNGDTIVYLENGVRKTAHLLGVEAPTNRNGDTATQYLKQLVLNKEIEIENEPKGELVDKYGKYLVYGFIGGRSIQLILLEQGLVYASHHYKDEKYQALFQKGENIAKEAKTNLWNKQIADTNKATNTNIQNITNQLKTKIQSEINTVKEKVLP